MTGPEGSERKLIEQRLSMHMLETRNDHAPHAPLSSHVLHFRSPHLQSRNKRSTITQSRHQNPFQLLSQNQNSTIVESGKRNDGQQQTKQNKQTTITARTERPCAAGRRPRRTSDTHRRTPRCSRFAHLSHNNSFSFSMN